MRKTYIGPNCIYTDRNTTEIVGITLAMCACVFNSLQSTCFDSSFFFFKFHCCSFKYIVCIYSVSQWSTDTPKQYISLHQELRRNVREDDWCRVCLFVCVQKKNQRQIDNLNNRRAQKNVLNNYNVGIYAYNFFCVWISSF